MKFAVQALLGLSLAVTGHVFAANAVPAGQAAAPTT